MTPHDRAADGEGMVVPEHRRTVELPCGAVGAWDNTGYRCGECLAIYGSIGCPCTPPKPQPVTKKEVQDGSNG